MFTFNRQCRFCFLAALLTGSVPVAILYLLFKLSFYFMSVKGVIHYHINILKWLHFVKTRLSNFLGNEFLVKMYMSFKIDTISNIMYI